VKAPAKPVEIPRGELNAKLTIGERTVQLTNLSKLFFAETGL